MPYPYSGIGKDWNYRAGTVLPEDCDAWERMAEEETLPVQAWQRQWLTRTFPHPGRMDESWTFPDPHVLYGIPDVLHEAPEEELHRSYLHALQRVTEPEEWVHAVDGPDACWLYGYRFWPHRGKVHAGWYVSPFPNGDEQYFLAQDFSWGILAFCSWSSCVFGQAIIDAFDADPPPGWRATAQ
jgi:hypothetical protein